MARHIDPPAQRSFTGVRSRREKYPYNQWTDGLWWEAEQGSDFFCEMTSFKAVLHNHAKTNGMKVETVKTGDTTLAFRFQEGIQ